MTDYCHLQLLCKLIGALKGLAKVLGPWPTVVLAGLVQAFAALCADHTFLILQMIVKAVFAAFFYWLARSELHSENPKGDTTLSYPVLGRLVRTSATSTS